MRKGACATPLLARYWNGKAEGGALSGNGFLEPYPPAVTFHDSLTDREADSGSRIFVAGMQPLKEFEDGIGELRLDSNSIVGD
ncbi:MAG TPA: hypothetical protein VGK64_07615 [Bryobacteraceae bacterium]